jgi:multiple sugar transport system ATP-binding protein
MNVFDGTLNRQGADVAVDLEGGRLVLPGGKAADCALDPFLGKKVKMGIRPEDIHEVSGYGLNTFETELQLAEMMGSEVLVYFDFSGCKAIGKFKPDTKVKAGSRVKFTMDATKIHLFDPETERTIINEVM